MFSKTEQPTHSELVTDLSTKKQQKNKLGAFSYSLFLGDCQKILARFAYVYLDANNNTDFFDISW